MTLRAGAAMVEITPKLGTHLAGAVTLPRPASTVLDPLYAKAVVFECGGKKVCFLSLDVVIITRRYTDQMGDAATAKVWALTALRSWCTRRKPTRAPSVGNFMIDDEFPRCPPTARSSAAGISITRHSQPNARSMRSLRQNLVPVEIASNSGVLDGLALSIAAAS